MHGDDVTAYFDRLLAELLDCEIDASHDSPPADRGEHIGSHDETGPERGPF